MAPVLLLSAGMGTWGIDLRLLYRLAPAFVLGAGLGVYGHAGGAALVAGTALVALFALSRAGRWLPEPAQAARASLGLSLLLALGVASGAWYGTAARPIAHQSALAPLGNGTLFRARAQILPGAQHRANGVRVPARIREIETLGESGAASPGEALVQLYVLEERNAWIYSPGAVLEITGRLQRPDNYANPGTHSYGEYLAQQGIEGVVYVRSPRSARVREWSRGLGTELAKRRDRFVRWVGEQAGERGGGGLVAALAAGDRSLVSADLTRELRDAGLSHILAISGLHVAIAGGFFFFLTRSLLLRSERLARAFPVRKIAVLVALAGVAAYAVLSGLSEATQRAGLMFGAAALALILEKRLSGLRALTLAALIIALAAPRALASISFQLSFTAAGTIILAFAWYSRWRAGIAQQQETEADATLVAHLWRGLKRAALALVVSSVAANLATWPLVAYYFNRVSLSGIVSNLLVLPVVELALLPFSLLSIILWNLHPPLAEPALHAAVMASGVAEWLAGRSAQWLPLRFDLRAPAAALIPVYFAGLLLAGLWMQERRRALLLAGGACLAVFAAGYLLPRGASAAQLEVQVVDAGRGRVRLARWPDGRTALFDLTQGRSSFPYYERAVLPALLAAGVGEVDLLVLGPGGAARAEALAFYRERLSPAEVWDLGESAAEMRWPPDLPDTPPRVRLLAKGGRTERGWAIVAGDERAQGRYVLDGAPGYWPTAWAQLWDSDRTVLDFAPRALGMKSNRWLVGRVDPALVVGAESEGRDSVSTGWARLRFGEAGVEVERAER